MGGVVMDPILTFSKARKALELAQGVVDGAIDTGVLQTNINQKLADLEVQYAPRLTTAESQSADKATISDLTTTNSNVTLNTSNLNSNHEGSNSILNKILNAIAYESSNAKISLPFDDTPTSYAVYSGSAPSIPFFPSVTTVNGELFTAIRTATDHATSYDGKIMTRKSTDGVTWSYVGMAVDNGRDARDVNMIVAPNGNLVMRFFDRSNVSWDDYLVKVKISTDNGLTWGNEIVLPMPPTYTKGVASRGNMTIKDGVIYTINYTLSGLAYVVKSADNGLTWTYVGLVNNKWKLNETSICYNVVENKFYFVARQQIYKTGVTPYEDYKNFMVIGESRDAITWENIKEIPLYGHAPSLIPLNDKKMLLSFKNTNTNNSTNNFQLNSVVLRGGNIASQVMNLANSSNYDSFYTDVTLLNSKIYFVYHEKALNAIRSLSLSFDDVDKLSLFSHTHVPVPPDASNTHDGYLSLGSTFMVVFQEEDLNFTLNASSTYNMRVVLHKPFTTRPYNVNAYLYRPSGDIPELDNVIIYARILNASNVSVTFQNLNTSNLFFDATFKLKICAFGG